MVADITFWLPIFSLIHQDLGLLLRIRQQQLENYHYQISTALIPMADEISQVTSLQVSLRSMQDCQTAKLLFDRMTSITRLTITMRDDVLPLSSREVFNTIFASGNAMGRSNKLRRLRLELVKFREVGTMLPKLLPFNNRTPLHLYLCRSTATLYEALSQLKLNLQSFHDECTQSSPQSSAVDAFLRSLSPLRQLRMTQYLLYRAEVESCDWKVLTAHAPNLQSLDLDDFPKGSEIFVDTTRTLPDFLAFCKSASNLQQLSIIGPTTEKAAWSTPYGLHTFLCCLKNLRSLRFLRLCVNAEYIFRQLTRSIKDSELPRVVHDHASPAADQIFDSLSQACPGLVAIVIDYVQEDLYPWKRVGFLRSKQTDRVGNERFVGRPVDMQTIEDYAMCCGILEDPYENAPSRWT